MTSLAEFLNELNGPGLIFLGCCFFGLAAILYGTWPGEAKARLALADEQIEAMRVERNHAEQQARIHYAHAEAARSQLDNLLDELYRLPGYEGER